MAGQKGMRPAPESLGGDHPAGRRTGISDRGGTIIPIVPPLSIVRQGGGSGGLVREKTATAPGGRLHAMRASDGAMPTWSRPVWRRRGTPDRTWWSSPAIGR